MSNFDVTKGKRKYKAGSSINCRISAELRYAIQTYMEREGLTITTTVERALVKFLTGEGIPVTKARVFGEFTE